MTAVSIVSFPSREDASMAVAERAAGALTSAIDARGSASIALSGGNTPVRAMSILSETKLDWTQVTIGLVDERFVPNDEDGSNEGLVRRTLMHGEAEHATFLPMWRGGESPKSAASLANTSYLPHSPFDFILLGMGGDGHTASWFPETADLETALSSQEIVIAVDSENVEGARGFQHRITLTQNAISEARDAVLLLFGDDRRETFETSLDLDPSSRPVRAAVDALGPKLTVFWAP